ncbi:MAG: pyruvate kinase [Fimbriimonadaceae bacterium]|nr:pyruvate kinase [Fimbriimonadaceae bacterium]
MKRRTKIVCTLGPAVDTREKIKELIDAGMNVARLNCSHGDWESKAAAVAWIRELSPDLGPVAILADLQGPKFRIGELKGGVVDLKAGESVTVGEKDGVLIPIRQPEIVRVLATGDRILMGDGEIELRLGAKHEGYWDAKVVNGGPLKSKKGLTVVGRVFDTPALTDRDRQDVYEACRLGVDFIALSYVKTAADMRELRRLTDTYDKDIRLCAKIETKEALRNIEEILKTSDVIMVARGDLGLQMDLEQVPMAQKKIIRKCNEAGKPVITATQMLESMMTVARPTRAEASDVANAILDGTDAIMLSGETASGAYPIEAVKTMAKIACEAEDMLDHEALLNKPVKRNELESTEAVAHSTARLASLIGAKAILTTTTSGQTTRLVSKFRPDMPILCATWDNKTQLQMAVVWGVEAIHIGLPSTTDEIVERAMDGFLRHKRLKVGDSVIVTAGVPAGAPGNTNLILHQFVK